MKLNQKQYAALLGVTNVAVSYRLKQGLKLPGITRIERFSRFYILHFNEKTNVAEAKEGFKKHGQRNTSV